MTGLRIGRKKQQYVEQCINSQTMHGFQALSRYRKGSGAMRANEAERGSGQRDRSRHRDRSGRRRKNDFRIHYVQKCTARHQKKCSGPENRDASSILLGKQIANAMTFRPFSSPAIDRGIGIGRVGVEKRRSISLRKHRARQQKSVRATKTAMRRFSRQTYSRRYDIFDSFR